MALQTLHKNYSSHWSSKLVKSYFQYSKLPISKWLFHKVSPIEISLRARYEMHSIQLELSIQFDLNGFSEIGHRIGCVGQFKMCQCNHTDSTKKLMCFCFTHFGYECEYILSTVWVFHANNWRHVIENRTHNNISSNCGQNWSKYWSATLKIFD